MTVFSIIVTKVNFLISKNSDNISTVIHRCNSKINAMLFCEQYALLYCENSKMPYQMEIKRSRNSTSGLCVCSDKQNLYTIYNTTSETDLLMDTKIIDTEIVKPVVIHGWFGDRVELRKANNPVQITKLTEHNRLVSKVEISLQIIEEETTETISVCYNKEKANKLAREIRDMGLLETIDMGYNMNTIKTLFGSHMSPFIVKNIKRESNFVENSVYHNIINGKSRSYGNKALEPLPYLQAAKKAIKIEEIPNDSIKEIAKKAPISIASLSNEIIARRNKMFPNHVY